MDNLRVEYIVAVDKNNTFCNSTEAFNNILTANGEIKLEIAKLIYKNLEITYEIKQSQLDDKNLHFFYLKFICFQIEKIVEFNEFLKVVKTTADATAYATTGQIKTLWDDIAVYYSIKSYPLINEIENLMRRLIVQFLLTNVGTDWDKEAFPKDLRENIMKNKTEAEFKKSMINILHYADFIQLSDCLFNTYFTKGKEIDMLHKQLKCAKDISELKLGDLKEFIPKSNWTRYFSTLVNCEEDFLKKRWKELYGLRCLVAHNRFFHKTNYERTVALINEIKPKLQKAIENLGEITVPEQEKSSVVESFLSEVVESFLSEEEIEEMKKEDDRLRKEFEKWAVLTYSQNRGIINEKKGGDGGIDGIAYIVDRNEKGELENREILFSVKSNETLTPAVIRELNGTVERENAACGILLTLHPMPNLVRDCKQYGFYTNQLMGNDYPKIQVISVQEILDGARMQFPTNTM